jgi:hypothetical protein
MLKTLLLLFCTSFTSFEIADFSIPFLTTHSVVATGWRVSKKESFKHVGLYCKIVFSQMILGNAM